MLTLAFLLAAAPLEPPRTSTMSVVQGPTPQELVGEMERLAAAQAQGHPLETRELDARLAAYGPRLKAQGTRALPLLSWYVRQDDRPLKVRLYAAAVLGLIGDPGALPALRRTAEDAGADPGLRAAAVQALGSLRLAPHELRPVLEPLAAAGPEALRREALVQLAHIGTGEPEALLAAAKKLGASPSGKDSAAAEAAAQALGRSPLERADGVLVDYVRFLRPGAPARAQALAALARRRAAGRPFKTTRRQLDVLRAVPLEEKGAAAVTAARLLGLLGDRRVVGDLAALTRRAPEAALAAEAAQALAVLGDPAGRAAVDSLAAGLASDPRFGAGPDDPRPYAAAVEAAARAFAGPAAKSAPPETFVYEGWPGLGTPQAVQSGAADLTLRLEPDRAAPAVVRLPKSAAAAPRLKSSVVVARRPGWTRARRAVALPVRALGAASRLSRADAEAARPETALTLAEGERLETLLSRGGGRCLVRRLGTVYDAACPELEPESFEVLSETVAEWWLELEHGEGRGWAHADDPALTILRD